MRSIIDRRILQFASGARRWIALTFLAGLFGSLANVLLLLLAGRVIVGIYEGRPLLTMADLFFGMLLAMALRASAEGSRDVSAQRSAAMVTACVETTPNLDLELFSETYSEIIGRSNRSMGVNTRSESSSIDGLRF